MLKLGALTLLLAWIAWQEAPPADPEPLLPPQPSPALAPADPGEELLQARCTSCHGRSRFADTRLDAAHWAETVERMIGHGARIAPDEVAPITDYLARTQGPAAGDAPESVPDD